jgi:lipopolysaccharide/colanic/teichoic acid biosynthesis glycosyltransferase
MDGISYADILSVIARSNDRRVNYLLVPNSLEAIVGKTRIDELDTIPLVEIEYNLRKPLNRIAKRTLDVVCSIALLLTVYPWVWLIRIARPAASPGALGRSLLLLPQVFSGRISLVGRPLPDHNDRSDNLSPDDRRSYLGPRGLTGLVQINRREDLTVDDIERYTLYYAKNHSIGLDLEIMFKSLVLLLKK